MSAEVRLVFVAWGHRREARARVESALRQFLLDENLLEDAALARSPHALVAYVDGVIASSAGAWASGLAAPFAAAMTAVGAKGSFDYTYTDDDDFNARHWDVYVVRLEPVDEAGLLGGLAPWLEGRGPAPEALRPIEPLVREARLVRERRFEAVREPHDPWRRTVHWAPRAALQRVLHAAHAWAGPPGVRHAVVLHGPDLPPLPEWLAAKVGPAEPPADLEPLIRAWSPPDGPSPRPPDGDEGYAPLPDASLRPGGLWLSHAALRARRASLADERLLEVLPELSGAIDEALAAGHGLSIDVEEVWPRRAPSSWKGPRAPRDARREAIAPDWAPGPLEPEAWVAIASEALGRIGARGTVTASLDPGEPLTPRLAFSPEAGSPVVLPCATPAAAAGAPAASDAADFDRAYWRAAQPAWEAHLVASLFPVVGPGFALELLAPQWSPLGVEATLRVSFRARPSLEERVLVPREKLDGKIDYEGMGEILVEELADDGRLVRAWRERLAYADPDEVDAARSLLFELPPPPPPAAPPRAVARFDARCFGDEGLVNVVAHVGETLVLSRAHPDLTCVVDLASDPPRETALEGLFINYADVDPGGRVVAVARRPGDRAYRLYELDLASAAARPLTAAPTPWAPHYVRRAGGSALTAPYQLTAAEAATGAGPQWLDGRPLALPDGASRAGPTEFDVRPFGDGSTLVAWQGRGYRLDGPDAPPVALPLGDLAPEVFRAPPPLIAEPPDGALTIDRRELRVIARDGARRPVLPRVPNVMALAAGPGGSLIVCQGDALELDLVKVVWRATGEVTSVARASVGARTNAWFACYLPSRHALWCQIGVRGWAIPWETVEALPRRAG